MYPKLEKLCAILTSRLFICSPVINSPMGRLCNNLFMCNMGHSYMDSCFTKKVRINARKS